MVEASVQGPGPRNSPQDQHHDAEQEEEDVDEDEDAYAHPEIEDSEPLWRVVVTEEWQLSEEHQAELCELVPDHRTYTAEEVRERLKQMQRAAKKTGNELRRLRRMIARGQGQMEPHDIEDDDNPYVQDIDPAKLWYGFTVRRRVKDLFGKAAAKINGLEHTINKYKDYIIAMEEQVAELRAGRRVYVAPPQPPAPYCAASTNGRVVREMVFEDPRAVPPQPAATAVAPAAKAEQAFDAKLAQHAWLMAEQEGAEPFMAAAPAADHNHARNRAGKSGLQRAPSQQPPAPSQPASGNQHTGDKEAVKEAAAEHGPLNIVDIDPHWRTVPTQEWQLAPEHEAELRELVPDHRTYTAEEVRVYLTHMQLMAKKLANEVRWAVAIDQPLMEAGDIEDDGCIYVRDIMPDKFYFGYMLRRRVKSVYEKAMLRIEGLEDTINLYKENREELEEEVALLKGGSRVTVPPPKPPPPSSCASNTGRPVREVLQPVQCNVAATVLGAPLPETGAAGAEPAKQRIKIKVVHRGRAGAPAAQAVVSTVQPPAAAAVTPAQPHDMDSPLRSTGSSMPSRVRAAQQSGLALPEALGGRDAEPGAALLQAGAADGYQHKPAGGGEGDGNNSMSITTTDDGVGSG